MRRAQCTGRTWAAVAGAALAGVLACAQAPARPPQEKTAPARRAAGKDAKMSPQEVADRVRKADWTVIDVPEQVGPDAGPPVARLLENPDSQVRELAVKTLHLAGGAPARDGLLRALHDKSQMVRAAAVNLLPQHVTADDLPALETEVTANPDEYVREHVALIVGRLSQPGSVTALRRQFALEQDVHARRAEAMALARLGDSIGRDAIVARLHGTDPQERAAALSDLVYVNDRGLLREAAALLDDQRDAVNVGPSHGPYYIRVCDVAVNTIDALLGHAFGFTAYDRRYSAEQIAQARAAAVPQ